MYENIKKIRPFFFSLREIENNVSLDIKIPSDWNFVSIVTPYSLIKTKLQDKNDKFNLLSLISVANDDGYNVVFSCANEIIRVNKEEEEKIKLFQEKVKELEHLFKNETLEKLKEIKLIQEHGEETTTRIGMVGKRDEEGQDGTGHEQIEND